MLRTTSNFRLAVFKTGEPWNRQILHRRTRHAHPVYVAESILAKFDQLGTRGLQEPLLRCLGKSSFCRINQLIPRCPMTGRTMPHPFAPGLAVQGKKPGQAYDSSRPYAWGGERLEIEEHPPCSGGFEEKVSVRVLSGSCPCTQPRNRYAGTGSRNTLMQLEREIWATK